MTLAAVASHATGDQIRWCGSAAVRFGDYVINGWAAAKICAAVGALIVPSQQDLITR
jgi:hypothetical protein